MDYDAAINDVLQVTADYHRRRAALMLIDEGRAQLNETLRANKAEGRYSLKRLFRASGEFDPNAAPQERAVSVALANECGRAPRQQNGVFLPIGLQQRDMTVASGAGGGYLVSSAQELALGVPGAANSFLSLCTLIRPGVNTGAQRIGKFTALPTVTVLADETSTTSETTTTVGQSLLTPSNATTYLEESRQLALQSEGGAQAIAQLLTNALRTHVGVQILEGSGASGQVLGLSNDSTITNTSGATLAMAAIATTMEVVERNAGDGALAWICTAPAAKLMRQRAVITGGAAILADGKIGGYPCIVIGGTTSASAAFGKWSDMLVYEWTPLEIAVNPFAAFQQAILGVRGWVTFNAAPLASSSFAVITSIT